MIKYTFTCGRIAIAAVTEPQFSNATLILQKFTGWVNYPNKEREISIYFLFSHTKGLLFQRNLTFTELLYVLLVYISKLLKA